mgnify:FL=1|jgi:hypothetical protein
MIEILIACSPRLDGGPTICPPHDWIPPLEKRVSEPKVIEEKDFTNPFEYVTIYKWKYEFNKNE